MITLALPLKFSPQRQKFGHDPEQGIFGDCYRSCIAIILGRKITSVPHFCNADAVGDEWLLNSKSWLANLGLSLACFTVCNVRSPNEAMKVICSGAQGIPMIMTGRGPQGINHCVVVMDGQIICDPAGGGGINDEADGAGGYQFQILTPMFEV